MNTPKDTDLREALRRKYANTPQMKLSLTPRPLQGERELKRKVFPLSWRGIGGGLIAASIALLIAFNYNNEVKSVEEHTVVAETIEQSIPQPAVSEPIVEEKKEEALPEVQPTPQPVKKRRKSVKKQNTPIEEPLLAKTEPAPQGTTVSPETEQSVAQYHNLRTIQITTNQSVYIIETSDRPEMEAIASMSELRARGQRLTANIELHHQACIVF